MGKNNLKPNTNPNQNSKPKPNPNSNTNSNKNENSNDNPNCKSKPNKFSGKIPENVKSKMLNNINSKRNQLAIGQFVAKDSKKMPQASNMNRITWSDELEQIAQKWANTLAKNCKRGHNHNRGGHGENIYYSMSSRLSNLNFDKMRNTFIRANDGWWSEIKDMNVTQYKKFVGKEENNKKIGHFTQMAWAKTSKIGCGYALFENIYKTNEIVVCNYSASGNKVGQPIYEEGKPCSKCEDGKDSAK